MTQPMLGDVPAHLPGCTAKSLAELHSDERQPDGMSDFAWRELLVVVCAEGCPRSRRAVEYGLELMERGLW